MNPNDKSLDEQLRALPCAVEPPQDLWPAIQSSIQPRRSLRWPLAMAASLAVAVSGWLHAGSSTAPNELLSGEMSAVSFAPLQQPGYLRAHAQLESLFRERLSLLQPDTRAKIEANLQ